MRPREWTGRADGELVVRVDLHLHSYASGAATNWWVKGLGLGVEIRESYTPPADAYRMVKAAGMNFVTLTDHETIAGAQTLVDWTDFFIGEEVAAIFPEDGSSADILIYGHDATLHDEIQARRGNIYRLVDFLRDAQLVHVLAHPVFTVGTALDRAGLEKRMVLFGLWEWINGSRPAEQNDLTREVAEQIGSIELRQLAHKHGLPVPPHRRIAGTGGSDDHGGAYGGATWTVLPAVTSTTDLLAALAAGECRPAGESGSVDKMVYTGLKLASAALASRDREPASAAPKLNGRKGGIEQKLVENLPLLTLLDREQIRSALLNRYEQRLSEALDGDAGPGFPTLSLLSSLSGLVEGHLYLAPYLVIHGYFGRECDKSRTLRRELGLGSRGLNAAIFVDELDQIHGVATMYRNIHRLARRTRHDRISVVHCGVEDGHGTVTLRPVARMPLPLYEGRTLSIPSMLEVLEYVERERVDVILAATPGPLGLAALVAGATLGIPVVGAYHTEFGAYAGTLSGDQMVGDIVDRLIREFYQRCSAVLVPSHATALALRSRGYRIDRFDVLRNGVDTALFHPERRDPALHDALGGGRQLLLYAGRVSREKGLERLAEDYLGLRARRDDLHLVIAGDGPYRAELEALLGDRATFTGFLRGEELARTFASCDLFLFPSTTDTLGRAVAEAQASGLPAVVYGLGGPRECIIPGRSGLVIDAGDETVFLRRVEELLDDPARRRAMGQAGREFALTLSWEGVFDGLLDVLRDVAAGPAPADPVPVLVERFARGASVA